MPKKPPKGLKPYLFHGLDLQWEEGDENATANCPFCGRDGKFGVVSADGRYNCHACRAEGNAYTFLRWLWKAGKEQTTVEQYEELAEERGLLSLDTLVVWGVCRSPLRAEWLVPGFGVKEKMQQLYRWVRIKERWLLLTTPTLPHRLHGVDLLDGDKPVVWLCEGIWDAMVLWEVLRGARLHEGMLVSASDPSRSLGSETSVLAAPGSGVFRPEWVSLFAGRHVVLAYDSDHPRTNPTTGKPETPSGWAGVLRAGGILAAAKKPLEEVRYLRWGVKGYDPDLPSGYDLRDALQGAIRERIEALGELLGKLTPLPPEALKQSSRSSGGGREMGPRPCSDYRTLRGTWRRALHWTDGLDRALVVMLASAASTMSVGDQLWIKVIGPAACGKSTLAEALAVCKEHVKAISTLRGFHSGYRVEGGGKEQDNSLVPQIRDKTLILKDGDTLLQAPNLGQILSEARDLYDGTARPQYRNAMSKDQEGIRMTFQLLGTSSLRSIDSSELGERFLDCVIMEGIDDDLEDEIGWLKANQAARHATIEVDGDATTHYSPELVEAMCLTGGYVEWLREHAVAKVRNVVIGEEALRSCAALAKFVAYMRARPSVHQEENAERELSSRLVSQLVRLAQFVAVVLNCDEVDGEVMERVRQVALDTSRGLTLRLVDHLRDNAGGLQVKTLAMLLAKSNHQVHHLLRFLRALGAVRTYQADKAHGVKGAVMWKVSERLEELYQTVFG